MTGNNLTYREIETRCKDATKELAPDMPTKNTLEAWESFLDELESFDVHEGVNEYVESWDWSIYTHFGWKILHCAPQSMIDDAESAYLELNHGIEVQELEGGTFDIWSLQSSIAYFVLVNMVQDELNGLIQELIELAETQIDNMESE